MEPASVLAFVLLGLKSAKVAYKILSSFEDAPGNVKSTTADVERLLLTLERLSTCAALEERGGAALRASLDACRNDLESFANTLTSLTHQAQSSRRDKYWKRFMAIWGEKDLLNMSAKVASHTRNLNLYLNILLSDAVADIPARLDSISRELAAQQTPRDTHLLIIKEQTAAIGAVNEGITSLGGDLDATREAILALSSASTASHLETRALLERIVQQLAGLSLSNQYSRRVAEVQDDGVTRCSPHEEAHLAKSQSCKELESIIIRLCDRVTNSQLEGRIMTGNAKDIICDLLLALELMKSEEALQTEVTSGLVEQGLCLNCIRQHKDDLQTSLTAVHAVLLGARQVAVNDICGGQQRTSGTDHQSRWTLSTYRVTKGTSLLVLSRRRSRRTQHLSQLIRSHSRSLERMEEEVTTSISLVSGLSQARHAIKVNIHQRHSYDGVFSAVPQLLVYNVLPADSPVFSIVRQGRLREFQTLLLEGKASLRDQDEYGASLLFYANKQPEICQYLIQSGADVNHVASVRGVRGGDVIQSALDVGVNDDEAGEELEQILACRKYLLEAGIDPTIPRTYESEPDGSKYDSILDHAVPEALRILFDFGAGFVNVNTKDQKGLDPLMMVCDSGRWSAESIAILLQRNADVTECDGYGRTCLHYCLSGYLDLSFIQDDGSPGWIHRFSMGIILLINHGADVYAKDRFGLSVSDIAYTEDNSRRWLGSARGDIWDFALALSGYNISDFRQGRHRKARYGTAYTRQDFETLWAGHEHLCPYYDIEDYYDEDADSRVSSDDENDEGFTTDSEDEGFTTDSEDEGFTTDSEDGGVDVVDMEEESPSASYSERETGSSGGI